MAFVYALDPLTPAGGEAASLGDDRIREFKNAMIERANSRFVSVDSDPWIIKTTAAGNTQSLIPIADNTHVLGTAALRFSDVRAVLGTIPTLTVGTSLVLTGATITGASFAGLTSTDDIILTGVGSDLVVAATAKLRVDGSVAGDTYITESSANVVSMTVGGSSWATFHQPGDYTQFSGDLKISALKKFYVDGGGDTYVYESAANTIRFVVGGANSLAMNATKVVIPSTIGFYLDDGGDTYIYESSANNLRIIVGGATAISATTTTVGVGIDFSVDPTKKVYVDGGGNTYMSEFSADVINFVAGGVDIVRIGSSYLAVNPTIKFYLDGGGDTYIYEVGADDVRFYAGGVNSFRYTQAIVQVLNVDFAVPATKKLYLDGAGDTYVIESAANVMDFYVGGVLLARHDSGPQSYITSASTVSAANMRQEVSGSAAGVKVNTSLRKWKSDIVDLTLEEARHFLFGARPRVFTSACPGDDRDIRHIGMIAEEVYEVDSRFTTFTPSGDLMGLSYERFAIPLFLIVQDHEMRLQKLERPLA